jgi:hypothetical protein
MEETLRRVYLQGTSEQRERLGVCGNCGRGGHTGANCPRSVAVEAVPMPLSAAAKAALERAADGGPDNDEEEEAPAQEFRYFDPSLLQFSAVESGETATAEGSASGGGVPGARVATATLQCPNRPTSEGGVLVVAEKPSVAKAVASHLSNGKMRTASNADGYAPMCKLHYFHHYFPPAKGMLPVVATSVRKRAVYPRRFVVRYDPLPRQASDKQKRN